MTPLVRADLPADPVELFGRWLDDARNAGLPEPTAMALCTATRDGRPSSRMVLLKRFDAGGFVFATNCASRKGREIDASPHASLLFYWNALERQVRIEGGVERTSAAESDEIFRRRPRGARIGAIASRQSDPLTDRETLHLRFDSVEREVAEGEVPRPEQWGGYRVLHSEIEFWEGRPHRLHDRIRYRRADDASWRVDRLWP